MAQKQSTNRKRSPEEWTRLIDENVSRKYQGWVKSIVFFRYSPGGEKNPDELAPVMGWDEFRKTLGVVPRELPFEPLVAEAAKVGIPIRTGNCIVKEIRDKHTDKESELTPDEPAMYIRRRRVIEESSAFGG